MSRQDLVCKDSQANDVAEVQQPAAPMDVSCVSVSAHKDVPDQLALVFVKALQDAVSDSTPTPFVESLQTQLAGRHSMPKADSVRNVRQKQKGLNTAFSVPGHAVGPDKLAVDMVKALRDATVELMSTPCVRGLTQRLVDWITCEMAVPR